MAHDVKLKPPAPVPSNDMTKPVLPGKGASDYERYLRTDELLALQKNADQLLHPDEITFQVVHQSSELLLKGACWELERARGHIAAEEYRDACVLLRRANQMLDYPIALLHVLETITPYDYHVSEVTLTEVEAQAYLDLSEQIAVISSAGGGIDEDGVSRAR